MPHVEGGSSLDSDLRPGSENWESEILLALAWLIKSCGQAYCHSGHAQKDRNHTERVKKSMMGTLAGMISGLRYQWGAQGYRDAIYGVRAIEDKDGSVPLHSRMQLYTNCSLSHFLVAMRRGPQLTK